MSRPPPKWALPFWKHKRPKAQQRAILRERYGDDCWLCGQPMRFDAKPSGGLAATIEHLRARANGGGDGLTNLRLCHAACNRRLANRTPEEKERLRARRLRREARRLRCEARP